jgi:hypothetical protein
MNNEIENINDEINLFFNNIQQVNEKKKYIYEYKNYEEILSDEEQLKKILENSDEKSILRLKNTIFKTELNKEDENKLLLRINKENGYLYRYVKIVEIKEDSQFIKICGLKSEKIKLIDSSKYYLFVLKYNNFRDYLESFLYE